MNMRQPATRRFAANAVKSVQSNPIPLYLYLAVAIIFMVGCNRQEDSTEVSSHQVRLPEQETTNSIGRSLNSLRKDLGLRQIGDNWVLYRSIASEERWMVDRSRPDAKILFKDNSGNIYEEQDTYYSGGEFEGLDGHDWERVVVSYDYRTKEIAVAYSGTNELIEAVLSKYFMTIDGGTTNLVSAMTEVNKIVAGWPNKK